MTSRDRLARAGQAQRLGETGQRMIGEQAVDPGLIARVDPEGRGAISRHAPSLA